MKVMLIGDNLKTLEILTACLREYTGGSRALICGSADMAVDIAAGNVIEIAIATPFMHEKADLTKMLRDIRNVNKRVYTMLVLLPGAAVSYNAGTDPYVDDFIATPFKKSEFCMRFARASRTAAERKRTVSGGAAGEKTEKAVVTAGDIKRDVDLDFMTRRTGTAPAQTICRTEDTAVEPEDIYPYDLDTMETDSGDIRAELRRKPEENEFGGIDVDEFLSVSEEEEAEMHDTGFETAQPAAKDEDLQGRGSKVKRAALLSVMLLVTALMTAFCYFLIQGRIGDGEIRADGYKLTYVSGSAANSAYNSGTLLIVEKKQETVISIGDMIAFRLNSGDGRHDAGRVAEVSGGGAYLVKADMQGDQEPVEVSSDDVLGRVAYHVPALGHILRFADTVPGLIAFICLTLLSVVAFESVFSTGDRIKGNGSR